MGRRHQARAGARHVARERQQGKKPADPDASIVIEEATARVARLCRSGRPAIGRGTRAGNYIYDKVRRRRRESNPR